MEIVDETEVDNDSGPGFECTSPEMSSCNITRKILLQNNTQQNLIVYVMFSLLLRPGTAFLVIPIALSLTLFFRNKETL